MAHETTTIILMITVHFIAADNGHTTTVQAQPGKTLMQVAISNRIGGIAADCGGLLSCATCHVHVCEPLASDTARLPPAAGDETSMLEFVAAPRTPHSRLSCQIQLTAAMDGLTVELPLTQY